MAQLLAHLPGLSASTVNFETNPFRIETGSTPICLILSDLGSKTKNAAVGMRIPIAGMLIFIARIAIFAVGIAILAAGIVVPAVGIAILAARILVPAAEIAILAAGIVILAIRIGIPIAGIVATYGGRAFFARGLSLLMRLSRTGAQTIGLHSTGTIGAGPRELFGDRETETTVSPPIRKGIPLIG